MAQSLNSPLTNKNEDLVEILRDEQHAESGGARVLAERFSAFFGPTRAAGCVIALALILFEGGLTTGVSELRPVAWPAMSLALFGTLLTALLAGLGILDDDHPEIGQVHLERVWIGCVGQGEDTIPVLNRPRE